MATWYKDGVHNTLCFEAQEGLRRVKRLFDTNGQDLFVTSINDSSHSMASYHYTGRAFDIRPNKLVSVQEIRDALGPGWDVVDESNHVHIELERMHEVK